MYSIFLFKLLKIPRAGARGLLRNLGPSQAENPKLLLLNFKSYRAYTFTRYICLINNEGSYIFTDPRLQLVETKFLQRYIKYFI